MPLGSRTARGFARCCRSGIAAAGGRPRGRVPQPAGVDLAAVRQGVTRWPVVRDEERRPLTLVRSRVRPASDVLLGPGQTTSFALLWVSAFDGACIHGDVISPYRAEIRVPGDSHPIPLQGPAVQPCEDLIEVTTFGSAI
jgi:hypothetical protein